MPAMMSTEAMRKRNHKISANRRYVMKVVLERYHGLGNDYVVFDPNKNELELNERMRDLALTEFLRDRF